VGTVENGYNGIAELHVWHRKEILNEEKKALVRAREMVPRIFLNEIDALVVANFGKEISGSGVDPAVVGRFDNNVPNSGLTVSDPTVRVLAALRLTLASHGNSNGIGRLDLITKSFYDSINHESMYINALTGSQPRSARTPVVLDTELLAVKACLRVCGVPDLRKARLVLVHSTKYLDDVYMSRAAFDASDAVRVTQVGEYQSVPFDKDDRLTLF
jgi:hypothetical protein